MSLQPLLGPRALRGKVWTATRHRGHDGGGAGGEALYLDDGLVRFDERGTLVEVRPFARELIREPVLDVRPGVILPGFVDTHVHFPQTRIVGRATGPLLDWLDRTVFPEEARFRERAYADEVAGEFLGHMLRAGTTTAMIFSSSSPVATACLFEHVERSGMRAIAGLTLMDQNCPEALRVDKDEAIAACGELLARFHGADRGRLGFAVTPRFALSCSRGLMEAAGRLAQDNGLYVQTHIAENAREGVATLEAHPWATSYLDVYDQTGLLGPRTLLAHAIHLSESELSRLAEVGGAIAHCPDSNFFLGSGRMPLASILARGVRVGLGSDVAAGRSFDMRRAVAYAYDTSLCVGEAVAPEALLTLATLGGARALGLSDRIGTLEPGKDADLCVVDLPTYATDRAQVISLLAFGSDLAKVSRVLVRGRSLSL